MTKGARSALLFLTIKSRKWSIQPGFCPNRVVVSNMLGIVMFGNSTGISAFRRVAFGLAAGSGRALVAGAVLTMAVLVTPAAGEEPRPAASTHFAAADPFSSLVDAKRVRSPQNAGVSVQRFVTAADNRVFLLESDRARPRVKFLCGAGETRLICQFGDDYAAEEIVPLTPTRGPRGDTIYRDPRQRVVLRLTPYGNATVYWPGTSRGAAATKMYIADAPLRLFPYTHDVAREWARTATALLSARLSSPIIFDIDAPVSRRPNLARARQSFKAMRDISGDGASSNSSSNSSASYSKNSARRALPAPVLPTPVLPVPVLADAIARTAEGIDLAAAEGARAAKISATLNRVRFIEGETPGVWIDGPILTVRYSPKRGIAGRPGSVDIANFLEAHF